MINKSNIDKKTREIIQKAVLLLLCLVVSASVITGCGATKNATESGIEDTSVATHLEQEDRTTDSATESGVEDNTGNVAVHLERDDWADDVKQAVNDLVDTAGICSADYDPTSYAVFDFDNTTSIFDVEEQLAVYQLQTMSFALTPEELPDVLATDLSDLDEDLTSLGYGKGSYNDWISDISAAYSKLYDSYGPFTPAGLDEATQKLVQADAEWQEFATKMRAMYDLVYDNESANVAYPWILYWFTGMTEDQVYDLAKASHSFYKSVETSKVSWASPTDLVSAVGPVTYEWTSGVQVSENLVELWKVLDQNGIDVWVCSASDINVVRAAVDVFGLHDYCTGVIAMTNKIEDEKYANAYDYDTGFCQYPKEDGSWVKGQVPTKAQTQGSGKVDAIDNILCAEYGHGPLCGFMDSTGDFNFCTEYNTLKLVICFNRASRKVTDGGGLIAEIAMYEKDTLNYDLETANAAGDTLYVLQGRDENAQRTLRNSNKTLLYGSSEEKLFKNEDNEAQLQYMIDQQMTVSEAINQFAVKTAADDSGNVLGFSYGFLKEYSGYHSR